MNAVQMTNIADDFYVSGKRKEMRAFFHSSVRRSVFHAAFAGLVEGRRTAGRLVLGRICLSYSVEAVPPLVKTAISGQSAVITEISAARTFFILASDEPIISHSAITSQTAM